MKNTLLVKKNKLTFSDVCIEIAYISLAIVSSYVSFLTFDVKFPAILLFIGLFFMATVKVFFRANVRLHKIILLLILRFVLFMLNCLILKLGVENILEQAIITVCSIMIFIYCYNVSVDIGKILLPFTILTCVQIFYSFVANGFSIDKTFIVSGIGGSNYAATFLLFMITYYLFSQTTATQKMTLVMSIFALLLTQSFACYLVLFVVCTWKIFKKVKWYSVKSVTILSVTCIIFILFCVWFFNTKWGYPIFEKVQNKLVFLFSGDIKNFSSSRVELYQFSMDNIKRHILFGSVKNINMKVVNEYQNFRTHNFILESLLLYGIVGSFFNLIILYYLIKSFRKNRNTAYIMVFVAMILHGFFEPNFFTMHFELFIWLIIGSSLGLKDRRR